MAMIGTQMENLNAKGVKMKVQRIASFALFAFKNKK
jgi:hypothetical protein